MKVKGKDGLIRILPLNNLQRNLLQEIYITSTNGDRIFVKGHEKTHTKMKIFQEFIRENRKTGISSTYHSLRHTYTQDLYASLVKSGLSDIEAIGIVAKRLGHGPNRSDITKIYLNK